MASIVLPAKRVLQSPSFQSRSWCVSSLAVLPAFNKSFVSPDFSSLSGRNHFELFWICTSKLRVFFELPFGHVALDGFALGAIPLVPFTRDPAGQIAIAQSKRQRETEGDRAKEYRKRCGDDLRADAEFLQRHERRKHNDA